MISSIQAFSHFTFEASCHEQIVVDIQGVGDLYTDPQIHTNLGFEYGGKLTLIVTDRTRNIRIDCY
jgi:hypothetical protein